jgi:hypothetical protein
MTWKNEENVDKVKKWICGLKEAWLEEEAVARRSSINEEASPEIEMVGKGLC